MADKNQSSEGVKNVSGPQDNRQDSRSLTGEERTKDLQKQTEKKKKKKAKKFGTFGGVFTPTLLTILGVILFLREGWVVGNAGLGGAILIILLAFGITGATGLSMSARLKLLYQQTSSFKATSITRRIADMAYDIQLKIK